MSDVGTPPRTAESTETSVLPTLEVSGLRKRFGSTQAVDDVGFTVGAHEIVCLVGPSGCGKSTVLRIVAGLQRPDAGQVRLAGRTLDDGTAHVAPERRGIGIVFQDHALFPNLTVGANVAFGLGRRGRRATKARVAEMLELVELDGYDGRYPHELSGGERQRVALARALAPEPEVLLLDEPFASLDHNLRIQVRTEVMRILRAAGTPAVFVTHDQLEALAVGDRVVVMRDGRIEQVGPPAAVFHNPTNRFVARFLGEADFVPAHVVGDRVDTELGSCALDGPPPTAAPGSELVVRPDDVVFVPAPEGAEEAAVISAAEFQGAWILYDLLLPSGRTVRSRRDHTVQLPVGTPVVAVLADHVVPVLVDP
jgi:iron(III) transport system ATP-binding protein